MVTDKQKEALEYIKETYGVEEKTELPEGTIEIRAAGEYGLIYEDGRIEWPEL